MDLKSYSVKFGNIELRLDQVLGTSWLMYVLNLIGLVSIPNVIVYLPFYIFFGALAFIFGLWLIVAFLMFVTGNGHKMKFTRTKK